eukprot:GFYU01018754.1.p1 GENE.GFYU01018754.1~~GFYU01018754.1.p1  ORF type:complete len:157 (-),score=21.25 GFYU01018754.1:266-736(-)
MPPPTREQQVLFTVGDYEFKTVGWREDTVRIGSFVLVFTTGMIMFTGNVLSMVYGLLFAFSAATGFYGAEFKDYEFLEAKYFMSIISAILGFGTLMLSPYVLFFQGMLSSPAFILGMIAELVTGYAAWSLHPSKLSISGLLSRPRYPRGYQRSHMI